jgi:transposase
MQVLSARCAGVDVPKKTVGAGVLPRAGHETRPVSPMPAELLALADGLRACGGTHVAMARTGDDWTPVCHILEGTGEGILLKAQPVKAVPGRQTDVTDAVWLAERWPHGRLRARVIPPVAPRDLRDLTRERSPVIPARVTLRKRGQKRLAAANLTRAAAAAEMRGGAGRAIRAALLAGPPDPQTVAAWAKGRRRRNRAPLAHAVDGRGKPPHRLVLTAWWGQVERLDAPMARVDAQIQAICGPGAEAVGRLDPLPGVARHTAARRIAESGPDRSRVPRADHLAAWAGVAPGHHASAGTRASGKTRTGHRLWRTPLGQAAHAAARTQGPDLRAPSRRLATRRGQKRAMMAVAPSLLVIADAMSQRQAPDRDAGADWCDRLQPEDTARQLVKRLAPRGDHVPLKRPSTNAMPERQQLFSSQYQHLLYARAD